MHNDLFSTLALLQTPEFFYPGIFLIGLLAGSFLNVVITRLPLMMEQGWTLQSMEYLLKFADPQRVEIERARITANKISLHQSSFNLVWPGSHCPQCRHAIRPWENIPVISYLFLRGRCSHCEKRIPIRYLGVELLSALLSLTLAVHYGPTPQFMAALGLTWLLIALTFIDIDTQFLPDKLTYLGLWAGLLISLYPIFVSPTEAILGAVFGYLSLWTLYWAFKLLTHKEGMGYGDFKLMAMAGAWVGWKTLPLLILMASFTGAVWGLISIGLRYTHKDHPLPFGPFIALALWVCLVYGDLIMAFYQKWVP
jgi:leader peptidase (prepilin peptidase)/N-methyltransferase